RRSDCAARPGSEADRVQPDGTNVVIHFSFRSPNELVGVGRNETAMCVDKLRRFAVSLRQINGRDIHCHHKLSFMTYLNPPIVSKAWRSAFSSVLFFILSASPPRGTECDYLIPV